MASAPLQLGADLARRHLARREARYCESAYRDAFRAASAGRWPPAGSPSLQAGRGSAADFTPLWGALAAVYTVGILPAIAAASIPAYVSSSDNKAV
jgi:hypothetical protein